MIATPSSSRTVKCNGDDLSAFYPVAHRRVKINTPPHGLRVELTHTQPAGANASNNATTNRLKQTQAQVDEVVGIMRVNVEKVLERDQKLSELDQRADALQHGASQFEQQAGKLKRKQWWANMKMMIIMGVIGVVLLIIIIHWER
uniref:V-SNARE coiled-coil homology domain-containing protein n=1 Tax=Anopheles melas TaxID=34690 RepID=A0A182TSG6_9DIPT